MCEVETALQRIIYSLVLCEVDLSRSSEIYCRKMQKLQKIIFKDFKIEVSNEKCVQSLISLENFVCKESNPILIFQNNFKVRIVLDLFFISMFEFESFGLR